MIFKRQKAGSTARTGPDGQTWRYAYGPQRELLQVTAPDQSEWRYTWAADGLLTSIEPPVGPTRTYGYDEALRRPTGYSLTDGNGTVVQHVSQSRTGPTETAIEFAVDGAFGTPNTNVIHTRASDGRGRTFVESWSREAGAPEGDLLSRRTWHHPDGMPLQVAEQFQGLAARTYAYDYDPLGRLTRRSEPNLGGNPFVTTYSWAGNVEQVTPTDAPAFSRWYDDIGRLDQITRDGDTLTIGYDALGRLESIAGMGLTETRSYLDPARPHKLTGIALGGTSFAYTYAPENVVTGDGPWSTAPSMTRSGSAGCLPSFVLASSVAVPKYGSVGRCGRVRDSSRHSSPRLRTADGASQVTSYWFDRQNRLAQVDEADGRHIYTLAADGVREAEAVYVDATLQHRKVFDYNGLRQIRSIRELAPSANGAADIETAWTDLTTDGLGRIKAYQSNATNQPAPTERTLVWDVSGRLLSLTQDGVTSTYAYNWRDQRIARTAPTLVAHYAWEDDGLLQEVKRLSGGPATTHPHLRGAGMTLAVGSTRLGHDHLGSPVLSVTAGIATPKTFDAWGRLTFAPSEISEISVGYTGHAYDAESGLTYAQARYYDPTLGLFLGPDPWEGDLSRPLSLGRFGYVEGNPATRIDPGGRDRAGKRKPYWRAEARSHGGCRPGLRRTTGTNYLSNEAVYASDTLQSRKVFDYNAFRQIWSIHELAPTGVETAWTDLKTDGFGRVTAYQSNAAHQPAPVERTLTWDAAGRLLSLSQSGATSTYAYNWRDQRIARTVPTLVAHYAWEDDGLLQEVKRESRCHSSAVRQWGSGRSDRVQPVPARCNRQGNGERLQ